MPFKTLKWKIATPYLLKTVLLPKNAWTGKTGGRSVFPEKLKTNALFIFWLYVYKIVNMTELSTQ